MKVSRRNILETCDTETLSLNESRMKGVLSGNLNSRVRRLFSGP